MNKQAVFNTAYLGLKSQNFERSMTQGGCVYRGNYGMKCAIGHIIADDEYATFFEDHKIDHVLDLSADGLTMGIDWLQDRVKKFVNRLDIRVASDLQFLKDLQLVHDFWSCDMQSRLLDLAQVWGLDVPSSVQLEATQ